jgi:superfamily II DNA or RNA helicase/HKD family nuclease
MTWYKNEFFESLKTGFVDKVVPSSREHRPQLLVNDQKAGKKVLTTIERELRTCDEFWLSVAFVTTSGIATLKNTLIELKERNISGKILASQYLNFTQPEALRMLLQFENIELKIVTDGDFHSKGYLFKKGDMFDLIIGSSNLTANALCTNKEWNLKVSASEQSELILQTAAEFEREFANATKVDDTWITRYELYYRSQLEYNRKIQERQDYSDFREVKPNLMQREALENIKQLRKKGKNKALLISATGTGKTYLSAFDVKAFQPKKFLFIVHRRTIAEKAMETYQHLFGSHIKMGIYSGSSRELNADFIFSTVQTISKDEHIQQFAKDHFDYIVIDETHRAGAASYQKIMTYFTPAFMLGMTATPERMDGLDVFTLFDHTIAYEIRLHKALEEEMLSPFHYYGVTDMSINDQVIEDKSDFNLLTAHERIERIIEKANLYGCDDGIVRGLIFCSLKNECHELSRAFNQLKKPNGTYYNTIALTGDDSEETRVDAIRRLESDQLFEKLDYIFTVDIFNEGIDIPRVNQIIMLRPTQSAIIFVQQLGRGLRKVNSKEYLTVIDFIGNYSNNYLVPIALYGDTSYNKDTLRNLISTGSQFMPGTSTINFDRITKEKIFAALDSANLQLKKDLLTDYKLLKHKIGRIPMMVDFIEHGSRDPFGFVDYSKSYFNFVQSIETDFEFKCTKEQIELLELFSLEINNAKRIEESVLLKLLLDKNSSSSTIDDFKRYISEHFGYTPTDETIQSTLKNLNFDFIRKSKKIVELNHNIFSLSKEFLQVLNKNDFKIFLLDNIEYAMSAFTKRFDLNKLYNGFVLGQKYSRKDVCRILNWETDISSTVYGYRSQNGCTPCFVTYQKSSKISQSTQYNDHFINQQTFAWESRSKRKIESTEIQAVLSSHLILLFVKKSDGEGTDFYCLGEVNIVPDTVQQGRMSISGEPVVHMNYILHHPVEDHLYDYLTDQGA